MIHTHIEKRTSNHYKPQKISEKTGLQFKKKLFCCSRAFIINHYLCPLARI